MHDVFISYSSKNKNVADAIVSDFEQNGLRCWYAPRDIRPGEEWVTAITRALEASKALVLIYTDESNNSRQVMNEIAVAFNAGITIVPFKLSNEQMSSELEYYLTRVHWLDAVSKPLKKNIVALREYIDVIIRTPNGAAPAAVKSADEIAAEDLDAAAKHKKKVIKILAWTISVIAILAIIGIITIVELDKRAMEQAYAEALASYAVSTDAEDYGLEDSFVYLSSKYPESYYYLGRIYERRGDYETAYQYYNTGLENESRLCLLGIGNMYYQGNVVDQDFVTAKEYFDNALFAGCMEAYYYEANMWAWGLIPGEEADLTKAKENADKALRSDDEEIVAMTYFLLGDICGVGYGGERMTRDDALVYYTVAVEHCPFYEKDSYDGIASFYAENRQYDLAMEWYLKAVELGNRHSMKMIGDMYYDGIGVEMDEGAALWYYLAACGFKLYDEEPWVTRLEEGYDDEEVFNRLGLICYYDYEYEQAAYFFVLTAEEYDNVTAMGNAGMAYEILQDWDNTLKWYGAAIDGGHSDSEYFRRHIRIMVDDGLVSEADAMKWL